MAQYSIQAACSPIDPHWDSKDCGELGERRMSIEVFGLNRYSWGSKTGCEHRGRATTERGDFLLQTTHYTTDGGAASGRRLLSLSALPRLASQACLAAVASLWWRLCGFALLRNYGDARASAR